MLYYVSLDVQCKVHFVRDNVDVSEQPIMQMTQ